jgi:hypothetical protein
VTTDVRSGVGLIEDCSGCLYCQPPEMEEIMEHLVAATEKIKTNQGKLKTS